MRLSPTFHTISLVMGLTASQVEPSHESPEKHHSEEQQIPREILQHHPPERLHTYQPEERQPVEFHAPEFPNTDQPHRDSLRDLGYEVTIYAAWRYEVVKYPDMTFYKIREPNTHTDIGRFAAHTNPTTTRQENELVVLDINTRADRRPCRPRTQEVLAGFWQRTLRRDILDLGSLYFDTVAEQDTVRAVRHDVCPLMQVAWRWHHRAPQAGITLRDPTQAGGCCSSSAPGHDGACAAWGLLHHQSRLVGLASSLLSAHPQMGRGGARSRIRRLDILPQPDGRGELFAFDLQVVFGV